MYSQSKGRTFISGQHIELLEYLVSTCPLYPDEDWEEDKKLNLILSKVQEHQLSLRTCDKSGKTSCPLVYIINSLTSKAPRLLTSGFSPRFFSHLSCIFVDTTSRIAAYSPNISTPSQYRGQKLFCGKITDNVFPLNGIYSSLDEFYIDYHIFSAWQLPHDHIFTP